jgi:acetyl-CoA carboxylase biotin carboxyl carrier protein
MAFTFKEVAEILKIIDASQCEEVVVELQGLRLVVRRGSPNGAWSNLARSSPPQAAAAHAPSPKGLAGAAKNVQRSAVDLAAAEGHIGVRAPMVGSFYRRPSPQEPPFVEVGQHIKTGDPLCLIEVMKLYTTIPSPSDGVLEVIAVEDRAAVEFDQLLFVIKPDIKAVSTNHPYVGDGTL